ncbi:hypothetical protein BM221_008539 [Beauveria bassiana]|uniref:Uncharacterized protein n=1 Tax=Beauveria bassiana TaxID=176275 RepID=A0A2N6ND22_BEABA|nr:hypothetical protein BM221_008539 [Beauveria bassiana]
MRLKLVSPEVARREDNIGLLKKINLHRPFLAGAAFKDLQLEVVMNTSRIVSIVISADLDVARSQERESADDLGLI